MTGSVYLQLFQQTTNPPSIVTEGPDAVTDPITAISESVRRNGTVTGQELAEETPSGHPAAREDKAATEQNWFSQNLVTRKFCPSPIEGARVQGSKSTET